MVENKDISCRRFSKSAGLATAATARVRLPFAGNNTVEATTANSIDELYEISKDYKQFNQKNEMYARMEWDTKFIPSPKADVAPNIPGYSVMNREESGDTGLCSWSSLENTKPPKEPWQGEPQDNVQAIKWFAKDIGVTDVGITTVDPRWIYSNWFHYKTMQSGKIKLSSTASKPEMKEDGTKVIPTSMKYVVVLLHKVPYDMVNTITYSMGYSVREIVYSLMAYSSSSVAEFIRCFGYNAIPMGNDTMLSVPLAVQAGLGEVGRNGLLISKFGPSVRICKVVTDLPLATDKPINLGVREFCDSCKKCARECPAASISHGEMTTAGFNISNNDGVKKWYVDCEKCRIFWDGNAGLSCARCIAICPYNKREGFGTHEQ